MAKSGFVVIAGRPNAGKSTLLNRILGANVSIVTPKAQTTRERVLGILTEMPNRGQMVFVDTPGIHRAKEGGINAYMVQEAREALDGPSVIWYIVDPSSELKHEEVVLDLLAEAVSFEKRRGSAAPILLLMNKVDLKKCPPLQESLEQAMKERGLALRGSFLISAEKGKGVSELVEATWGLLPEGPLYYPDEDQLSDRPTRYFVAEKVREQLLLQLGQEVPYSCAVEIEKFDEAVRPPRIEAVIHVERDSQKGMVVGKGGAKIKAIGQAARQEIEAFLGTQIFLGLRVKVLKDWTRSSDSLKRLGYTFSERKAQK